MFEFALSVMPLGKPQNCLRFAVKSLTMTVLLLLEFLDLRWRDAKIVDRALPATVSPTLEVFVETLAF